MHTLWCVTGVKTNVSTCLLHECVHNMYLLWSSMVQAWLATWGRGQELIKGPSGKALTTSEGPIACMKICLTGPSSKHINNSVLLGNQKLTVGLCYLLFPLFKIPTFRDENCILWHFWILGLYFWFFPQLSWRFLTSLLAMSTHIIYFNFIWNGNWKWSGKLTKYLKIAHFYVLHYLAKNRFLNVNKLFFLTQSSSIWYLH